MSRLFCSLLFCVCIWGQQTNTLFRTLTVTKNSPVAGEAITNSAPNIGQVYHQFNVTASGAGCVAKYFRSVVEGSFDNSVWSATNTFLTNIQFPSGTSHGGSNGSQKITMFDGIIGEDIDVGRYNLIVQTISTSEASEIS